MSYKDDIEAEWCVNMNHPTLDAIDEHEPPKHWKYVDINFESNLMKELAERGLSPTGRKLEPVNVHEEFIRALENIHALTSKAREAGGQPRKISEDEAEEIIRRSGKSIQFDSSIRIRMEGVKKTPKSGTELFLDSLRDLPAQTHTAPSGFPPNRLADLPLALTSRGKIVPFGGYGVDARRGYGAYGHPTFTEDYGQLEHTILSRYGASLAKSPANFRICTDFGSDPAKPVEWRPSAAYTHGVQTPLADRRRAQIEAIKKGFGT